jgi:hypothetical protein
MQNRELLVLLGCYLDITAVLDIISVKKCRSQNWANMDGTKETMGGIRDNKQILKSETGLFTSLGRINTVHQETGS